MPRCENCNHKERGCYYHGKEKNPRGRGFCASHEKNGTKMKGRDGRMYYVRNGRWIMTKHSRQYSPRGIYVGAGAGR